MKNFVKYLNKDGPSFQFIQTKFQYVSDAKLRAGVFDGPQVRELLKDSTFDKVLTSNGKIAWLPFKNVITNFLGKHRNQDCEDSIQELMQNFQALGARKSIKMHFLNSHLGYFPDNWGDYSEE